jgi:hypothetical protein
VKVIVFCKYCRKKNTTKNLNTHPKWRFDKSLHKKRRVQNGQEEASIVKKEKEKKRHYEI